MNEHHVLWLPLQRAFALNTAATVRMGRKIPGASYASLELAEAIDRATADYFSRK